MDAGRARRAALEEVRALPARPLISVVMPTYETEPRYLREAIDSVRCQGYPGLGAADRRRRLRLAELRRALERQARDERIEVIYLDRNSGISAATNAALALPGASSSPSSTTTTCSHRRAAAGRSGARRRPRARRRLLRLRQAHPARGRADPFFKPDWSPTYALGAMYIGHLLVVRRSIAERAGGFDSAFDTIQDFEFMLRV